jgi:YhcH/YjgK/YiaL family protein
MIIDRIENAERYFGLGERIEKALLYLIDNDLSEVHAGKYIIEKDQIVMLVNEYESTNTNLSKLEGHRKNIDVQYWVSGSELMGYSPLMNQEIIDDYNSATDCAFYHCNASFTKFEPGMFAIYFPTDLHTAVMIPDEILTVKKIVFKVVKD